MASAPNDESQQGCPVTAPSLSSEGILNLRMEFSVLATLASSIAQMFWTAFTLFFTINSFLAAGLAFAYSSFALSVTPAFLNILRTIVPIGGIVIAAAAIYTAFLLSAALREALTRGRTIDEKLNTATFIPFSGTKRIGGDPWVIVVISVLFIAGWIAVLPPTSDLLKLVGLQ
jgi:hypothetical protein